MEPEGVFSPRTATIKQMMTEKKDVQKETHEKGTIAQQSQGYSLFFFASVVNFLINIIDQQEKVFTRWCNVHLKYVNRQHS